MAPRHARQIDNVSENITERRIRESRQRRAHRDFIQIQPTPDSSHQSRDTVYARRQNRVSLIEEANRKKRIRRMIIASIVVVAAVIVALTIAVQVFMRTTDSRLAIADSSVTESLVTAKSEQPFYMLCIADLKNPLYSYSTLQDEASMLVRIDEANKSVGFVSFPTHMYLKDEDGENVELSTLMKEGRYSEMVRVVSVFAGVDISHIAMTDFKMLEALVNKVGGIDVNLPQEIDDPLVGNSFIAAGESSLDGAKAMEMIRATNLLGGFEATAKNRSIFTEALISRILTSNQVELAAVLSDVANYVDTDWKTSDILETAERFKPYDSISFYSYSIPCSLSDTDEGEVVYTYKESEIEQFMAQMREGRIPSDSDEGESGPKESKITVEVRNGAGIDGAAATLGAILQNNGYSVLEVGNTNDDTLYPETLVVYTGTGTEKEAETVIQDIGAGRVVEGGDFYSSKADIIVIIGTDWA